MFTEMLQLAEEMKKGGKRGGNAEASREQKWKDAYLKISRLHSKGRLGKSEVS